jgi:hypothetical protein
MTDDELDRALFALPLEEPPPELHRDVMAATVFRPEPVFRAWEFSALAAALVVTAALTAWLFSAAPDTGARLTAGIADAVRSAGLLKLSTYAWLAVGLSAAWFVSSPPFMATSRSPVYNR